MTTVRKTATHRLIEIELDTNLKRLVRHKRRREISWRRIAADIAQQTGVKVTPVSLRNWFPDID